MISCGKYLIGLPTANDPTDKVNWRITADHFVFTSTLAYSEELGRIPRNSINEVRVDLRQNVGQRLTVTRMLTLGVFALAAPKRRRNEYCLVVDWDDLNGNRHNTVFEFTGRTAAEDANSAANFLNRHLFQKVPRLKSTERKCPFCAEVIQAEAVLCHYCGRDLPPRVSSGPRDLDRKPGALSVALRDAPHAALRWGSEAK